MADTTTSGAGTPVTDPTNPATTANPAAAPTGIIEQIQNAYQTQFGRPAEQAGLDFWSQAAANAPGGDISKMIGAGAQNQDIAARNDIAGGGVDLSATYQHGTANNWNADKNQWDYVAQPTGAATYSAAQLGTPTQLNVAANQTAQGQLTNMIDPNNPYYQSWAHAGANDAAARGFTGNSTIRDSAILDGVMRNATPIATNDAGIYNSAATINANQSNAFLVNNQNALNTANQFNAQQNNALNLANIQSATSRYGTDVSANTSLANTAANNATSTANNAATNATSTANTASNNATSTTNTASNNATTLMNAANNAYQTRMSTIANSTTMDAAAKQTAQDQATQDFKSTTDAIHAQNASTFNPYNTTSTASISSQDAAALVAANRDLAVAKIDATVDGKIDTTNKGLITAVNKQNTVAAQYAASHSIDVTSILQGLDATTPSGNAGISSGNQTVVRERDGE